MAAPHDLPAWAFFFSLCLSITIEYLLLLSAGGNLEFELDRWYRDNLQDQPFYDWQQDYVRTYPTIPPTAMNTPRTDLSPMARPEVIQPRATMVHVFTCPTTVLETGPVWAMMKN